MSWSLAHIRELELRRCLQIRRRLRMAKLSLIRFVPLSEFQRIKIIRDALIYFLGRRVGRLLITA